MRRNKILFVLFTVMLLIAVVPVSAQTPDEEIPDWVHEFMNNMSTLEDEIAPPIFGYGRAEGYQVGDILEGKVVQTFAQMPNCAETLRGTFVINAGQVTVWYWGQEFAGQMWNNVWGPNRFPHDDPRTPQVEGWSNSCGATQTKLQLWMGGLLQAEVVWNWGSSVRIDPNQPLQFDAQKLDIRPARLGKNIGVVRPKD